MKLGGTSFKLPGGGIKGLRLLGIKLTIPLPWKRCKKKVEESNNKRQ